MARSAHHAFNERNREAFLDCLAEDVVWHVAGQHPLAGTYDGRTRLWEGFMEPMWASPARLEDRELLTHGDHVVAIGDAVHDFGEGEQRFETVEVLRLDGGRLVERWEFTSRQAELDRLFTRGCAAAAGQTPD
ncbi:MAG: nuclear transport factor 2 family protein [Solirubrobacteraceae bacterium]